MHHKGTGSVYLQSLLPGFEAVSPWRRGSPCLASFGPIVHVVQHGRDGRDNDRERASATALVRKIGMEGPAVAIGLARLCHVGGIGLPAEVLHVRQVRAQMRRSAAYVEDAISQLGTDDMLRKVAPPPVRSHQTLHGFVQRWMAQSRK